MTVTPAGLTIDTEAVAVILGKVLLQLEKTVQAPVAEVIQFMAVPPLIAIV